MTTTNYTAAFGSGYSTHHVYLSTACLHANHAHCQCTTTLDGEPKIPGVCKWCAAPCVCTCHRPTPDQQYVFQRIEAIVDQALAQYETGDRVNVRAEMTQLAQDLAPASRLDT